ncbi:MAG: hypothetical protein ABJA90_09855 [Ginsengibacter sp.]
MRYTIAYYLMLLYVTVMLKPLIPIIADAFSHTFSETIHVETIHAKYGINHLEKELAASGNDSSNNKNQNAITSEEQVLIHLASEEMRYKFDLDNIITDYPFCKAFTLSSVFISKTGPPPKFS